MVFLAKHHCFLRARVFLRFRSIFMKRFLICRYTLLFVLFCLLAQGCSKGKIEDANVLLITVDTLRADHLGCYGYDRIETPNIDALARSGVLFQNANAQCPITLPSHASILTGTYPQFHRIRDNGDFFLSQSQTTLAEILKQHGFATGAVVSSFILDRQFGLDQGFDSYDDRFGSNPGGGDAVEQKADKATKKAIQWLEKNQKKRFFLWVHYMDPHDDYVPPFPYSQKYASNPYDGEIAFTDEQVGKLLDQLKEWKLDAKTIVILMADHGEGLGEHGESTHSSFIYESTMRIPLIISSPSFLPKEKEIPGLARSIDILPTVLNLLGLPPDEAAQGESLVPWVRGQGLGVERKSYGETMFNKLLFDWSALRSMKTDRWKYIHAPKPELYDLQADPKELHNLYDEQKETARKIAEDLKQLLESTMARGAGAQSDHKMDKDAVEKLRSLGYVAGVTRADNEGPLEVFEPSGRNPKDMQEILKEISEAGGHFKDNDFEKAGASFRKILTKDPDNLYLKLLLGISLYQEGKLDESRLIFESVLKSRPDLTEAHTYMSLCLQSRGDIKGAIEHEKVIVKLLPHKIKNYTALAKLYFNINNLDQAEAILLQGDKIRPGNAEVHKLLGQIYQVKQDYDNAYRSFQKAVELNPKLPEPYFGIAQYQLIKGQAKEAIASGLKGVELLPDQADSYFKMAVIYEQAGDLKQALGMLEKAVRIGPGSPMFHEMLGNIHLRLQRWEDAAREYRDAVKLNPNALNARCSLAESLSNMGKTDEAIKELSRLIKDNPEFMRSRITLGNIYMKKQDLQKASEEFKVVRERAPQSPEGWYNAACLESVRGNKDLSLTYLEKALELGGEAYRRHASQDSDLGKVSSDERFLKMVR